MDNRLCDTFLDMTPPYIIYGKQTTIGRDHKRNPPRRTRLAGRHVILFGAKVPSQWGSIVVTID
jgi:hypothetical protein